MSLLRDPGLDIGTQPPEVSVVFVPFIPTLGTGTDWQRVKELLVHFFRRPFLTNLDVVFCIQTGCQRFKELLVHCFSRTFLSTLDVVWCIRNSNRDTRALSPNSTRLPLFSFMTTVTSVQVVRPCRSTLNTSSITLISFICSSTNPVVSCRCLLVAPPTFPECVVFSQGVSPSQDDVSSCCVSDSFFSSKKPKILSRKKIFLFL